MMEWIAIIAWLLMNLPDLIALIMRLFGRTKLMTMQKSQSLRAEFTEVIRSKTLTRKEKRLKARAILLREEQAAVASEILTRGI